MQMSCDTHTLSGPPRSRPSRAYPPIHLLSDFCLLVPGSPPAPTSPSSSSPSSLSFLLAEGPAASLDPLLTADPCFSPPPPLPPPPPLLLLLLGPPLPPPPPDDSRLTEARPPLASPPPAAAALLVGAAALPLDAAPPALLPPLAIRVELALSSPPPLLLLSYIDWICFTMSLHGLLAHLEGCEPLAARAGRVVGQRAGLAELGSEIVGRHEHRGGGEAARGVLQADGGAQRVVDEVPCDLREVARAADALDVREQRPVRVLYREVEAEHAQQLALADEDLLLELPELLRVGIRRLDGAMLHLVRLGDDVLELLGRLLDL